MNESEQDAAARSVACEAVLIYVLGVLAAKGEIKLDKVHRRLTEHVTGALSGVEAMRPDRAEFVRRVEAVACATLDRMFSTAQSIS